MTSQHTPGPWSSDTDAYVVNNSDEVLADVFYIESHSPDLDPRLIRKANARLIAAAPDMLEALEDVLPWLQKAEAEGVFANCAAPQGGRRAIERARAAIARATGD
jgi:hypothetical protein